MTCLDKKKKYFQGRIYGRATGASVPGAKIREGFFFKFFRGQQKKNVQHLYQTSKSQGRDFFLLIYFL